MISCGLCFSRYWGFKSCNRRSPYKPTKYVEVPCDHLWRMTDLVNLGPTSQRIPLGELTYGHITAIPFVELQLGWHLKLGSLAEQWRISHIPFWLGHAIVSTIPQVYLVVLFYANRNFVFVYITRVLPIPSNRSPILVAMIFPYIQHNNTSHIYIYVYLYIFEKIYT